MKQSGFMAKQLAMRQALIDATERVTQQLMMDTLQITLHEFGWGYDRIMKLTKAWADAYNHYHDTLDVKNVEAVILMPETVWSLRIMKASSGVGRRSGKT